MAYAVVSHGAAAGNGSVGPSVTLNTTGANRIFLGPINWFGAQPRPITDSLGNTYTALTDYNDGVNFDAGAQILYSQDSPTVGSTHTISTSGTSDALAILAVSGSANSPVDTGTDKGNSSGNGTSIQPSAACVPNNNNEILVVVWVGSGNASSPTTPTNFTKTDSINGVSGTHYGVAMYYEIQTTATSRQPTVNNTTGSPIAIAICAFKAAAAATLKLFVPTDLNGLGAGGAFFHDRLAS